MSKDTASLKTRSIFVSSTFRDMHAERQYLRDVVFPVLEERLRERFQFLELIDLRLGVETNSEDERAEREKMVLKVCLYEIERSKPFFIAILGDRYGWVPQDDRMIAATTEAGFSQDMRGHSVTDLEIRYGVLDGQDQNKRSWFYFRQPLPYKRMPSEVAAIYSDQYNPDPSQQALHDKLKSLKSEIFKKMPNRVRSYLCSWDSTRNQVHGLEGWGEQVIKDLWSDLEHETEKFINKNPRPWQKDEKVLLNAFIIERTRNFCGRSDILNIMYKISCSSKSDFSTDQQKGLVITGEAGIGKSALFAKFHQQIQDVISSDKNIVLAHAAGISPRSSSVSMMLRRWVLELSESIGQFDHQIERSKIEDVEKKFHLLLDIFSTTQNRQVIILIDGIDKFEPSERSHYLTWMPTTWPQNVHIIVTGRPCEATRTLIKRQGIVSHNLRSLDSIESRAIADMVHLHYRQKVNESIWQTMKSLKVHSGQSAIGNPLWLTLSCEELNLIDKDTFELLESNRYSHIKNTESRIHQLKLDLATVLPTSVNGLYGWMLQRAERILGLKTGHWVHSFGILIAVSRTGWRESDLRSLMPIIWKELWGIDDYWDELKFSTIRRSFRGHVVQRGFHGQWDFMHQQLRIIFQKKISESGFAKINCKNSLIHSIIAKWLEDGLPISDPIRTTECPYHLLNCGSIQSFCNYYALCQNRETVDAASRALSSYFVVNLHKLDPVKWVRESLSFRPLRILVAGKLISSLDPLLDNLFSLSIRIDIKQLLIEVLEQELLKKEGLKQDFPISIWENFEEVLIDAYLNFGNLLWDCGNLNHAIEQFSNARSLSMKLYSEDASNWYLLKQIAESEHMIAEAELAMGRPKSAIVMFESALQNQTKILTTETRTNNSDRMNRCRLGLAKAAKDLGKFKYSLRFIDEIRSKVTTYQDIDTIDPDLDLLARTDEIEGEIHLWLGNYKVAEKIICRAIVQREEMAQRYPNRLNLKRYLSIPLELLGDLLVNQGKFDKSIRIYSRTLDIAKDLSLRDPDNVEYRRDIAMSQQKIAFALRNQTDLNTAVELCEAACSTLQKLWLEEPNHIMRMRDYICALDNQAQAMNDIGCTSEAIKYSDEVLRIINPIALQEQGNWVLQRSLAISFYNRASIEERQGNGQEGMKYYIKFCAQVNTMKDSGQAIDQFLTDQMKLICNSIGADKSLHNNA